MKCNCSKDETTGWMEETPGGKKLCNICGLEVRPRYNDFTEDEKKIIRDNTGKQLATGNRSWAKFQVHTENSIWSFTSCNPVISLKTMRVHANHERDWYSFFRFHMEIN